MYRLLANRFTMNGTIGILICSVMLMMATHVQGSVCPEMKTGKGPPIPVFTEESSPDDEMAYAQGQTYILMCCVRGNPKPSITWLRDNRPLLPLHRFEMQNDHQQLSINRVRPEDSGAYTCIAQNINGVNNHTIYLDIREWKQDVSQPELKIESPEKAEMGSNITLRCQVTSSYRPVVWWCKMNGSLPEVLVNTVFAVDNEFLGQYTSTLTIRNVSFKDGGIYKCRAKNGVGRSVSEKNISLTVVWREEAPPTSNAKEAYLEKAFSQKYLFLVIGGGLALVALIFSMMTLVYITKYKPEGWVTWKLIQMGVVKQPKCHAKTHGEDGDDECICVVSWDVFICYNSKDRVWVMNVLHKKLTNTYKVCIDYQNFVPGGGVVDNIARCIWRSKTTLFVVSRDFLRSGWSKMEFEITQDKIRRAQGSLVVILLDDIKWQELPPILRRFTTAKMHVNCKDKQLHPKAWRRLQSLLGSSFVPEEQADAEETPTTAPFEDACLLIMESSV